MKEFFLYILIFVCGGIAGMIAEYFVLRNNPQIVEKLEKELADAKADVAKYRQAYEDLRAKIKEKVSNAGG